MCGFVGFVNKSSIPTQLAIRYLDEGMQAIRHRGPDGQGKWVSSDGFAGLGHVRLSIIDIASGHQPMSTQDNRYVIAYNGEVYNYLELRDEIGGDFVTSSDTEVVLKAYIKWGEDCVNHFRGMFAFAIWDSHTQSMFIARDRFGIKPLYFVETKEGLFFGSEIKALLPFIKNREINNKALTDYFTFQFYLNGKTLLDGVTELKPAHCFTATKHQIYPPKKYWEVDYTIDYNHTESWFTQKLRDLVDESVSLHMRSDVEVGGYVSGGVDSSMLASIASEKNSSSQFKAFNGRFTDGKDFDESSYAISLAKQRNMELFIADISEQDFVDNITKIIWHLDQPVAGPGAFPQYMVSKKVSEEVKVVLGGQGGDEIFGGYARYLVAYFEQCIKGALEGTLNNGNYVVSYESIIPNLQTLRQYKPMLKEFWAAGLFEDRDLRYWRLINRANTFGGMLTPDILNQEHTLGEFKDIFWGENVGKESYFDSMTHFDFKTLLPALLQVEDRMGMAHGIESRVPFLDHKIIEFAATIPADIKFKNGELKRLLKRVFADKLPAEINNRKDKMGFPVPINLWLKNGGPARNFIGDLMSSQKAKSRSYLLNGLSVDKVLDSQSIYGRNLWALISLELWQNQFVD